MAAATYAPEHVLPGGTEKVGSVPVRDGHREDPAHAEAGPGFRPRRAPYDPLDTPKISISEATDTAGRKTT